jgi:hypothetical protein
LLSVLSAIVGGKHLRWDRQLPRHEQDSHLLERDIAQELRSLHDRVGDRRAVLFGPRVPTALCLLFVGIAIMEDLRTILVIAR